MKYVLRANISNEFNLIFDQICTTRIRVWNIPGKMARVTDWPDRSLWENDAGEGSECSSDKINFQAEMEEVIEVIVFAIYSG